MPKCSVTLSHLGVHLVVDDEVAALGPVAVAHRLGGRHHVLAHALGRTHQRLTLARPADR